MKEIAMQPNDKNSRTVTSYLVEMNQEWLLNRMTLEAKATRMVVDKLLLPASEQRKTKGNEEVKER